MNQNSDLKFVIDINSITNQSIRDYTKTKIGKEFIMKTSLLIYTALVALASTSVYAHPSDRDHFHDSNGKAMYIKASSTPSEKSMAKKHRAENAR